MKDDGGPAFPVTFEHSYGADSGTKSQEWQGMSLRDYFAAHAPFTLQDAIRVCGFREPIDFNDASNGTIIAILVLLRSQYADSMLAERAISLTSKE